MWTALDIAAICIGGRNSAFPLDSDALAAKQLPLGRNPCVEMASKENVLLSWLEAHGLAQLGH
jgi:hypothetical protein